MRPDDLAERSPRAFDADEPGVTLAVLRAEPWLDDEGPAMAPTLVLIRMVPAGGAMAAWVGAAWWYSDYGYRMPAAKGWGYVGCV